MPVYKRVKHSDLQHKTAKSFLAHMGITTKNDEIIIMNRATHMLVTLSLAINRYRDRKTGGIGIEEDIKKISTDLDKAGVVISRRLFGRRIKVIS